MGLFDEAEKLAAEGERLAKEHPDQVNQAVAEAEKWADQRTGDRYDAQIQSMGTQAENYLEKP